NRDLHARRRDIRELRNRQRHNGQPTQEQDEQRNDDRQCRSMKKFCEHEGRAIYSAWYFSLLRTFSGASNSYSVILSPSRTCLIPSRIILSFLSRPFSTTKMSSRTLLWIVISR